MVSLDEIHKQVVKYANTIAAPISLFPSFGDLHYDATPCVLVEGEQIFYIANERGNIVMKRKTTDTDELLFWVFCDISFYMAEKYEVNHRMKNLDSRRLRFSHQLELLGKLSVDWAKKRAIEIEKILRYSPYIDK